MLCEMGRWKYLPPTVCGLSEVPQGELQAQRRAGAEPFSCRLVPAGSHPHPRVPEGRRERRESQGRGLERRLRVSL